MDLTHLKSFNNCSKPLSKTTDYQGEHREGRQDRRVTPISLMRAREDDRGWKDGGMEG
ncbi:MAG: hypothetical protein F6J90_38755 [Moorea sp. SIOASIH]|uniref:hypothetical protein n=1 Tax=Moorena sp. SIOASIH TaxID=2607817 RepID=UPI0013BD8612|nr:hypothetical protein [Moorena sp. SIOASIH]NEO41949.1 hypothetical protein [Moorena sp. SIOASIH]NEO89269.1 hypothetical protein [Moorena sp. SIO3G5]